MLSSRVEAAEPVGVGHDRQGTAAMAAAAIIGLSRKPMKG